MATKRQSYTTSEKLKIIQFAEEHVFCAENVSVCGFNDNRNYNFFLESVLKNRVRIIYGCALYTGKYGILQIADIALQVAFLLFLPCF